MYAPSSMQFFYLCVTALVLLFQPVFSDDEDNLLNLIPRLNGGGLLKNALVNFKQKRSTPCTCGVFLDGQLAGDNRIPPGGNPALAKAMDYPIYPCGTQGNKLCMERCLDLVIHHMPSAAPLICSSINRDCFREKATVFVKNCDSSWKTTGFKAGKEFCCTDGVEVMCPKTIPFNHHKKPKSFLGDLLGSASTNRRSIPEFLLDIADSAADLATDVLGS